MTNNIFTYDEFNLDLTLSEGLNTMEFIKLLMEEEHKQGMDYIDEGFTQKERIPGSLHYINKTKFVPNKNDNKKSSTRIFLDDGKTFSYYTQPLEKSGVTSYNLYKFGHIWISKLLKHPKEYKLGDFTPGTNEIDEESMHKFLKRSALYVRSIIKEQNFDVDIITYPVSSSDFNEKFIKDFVMPGYSNIPSIKCIPNLFKKDIQTVEVNKERAKKLGMTDEQIDALERRLIGWKNVYKDIYPLRLELDRLKNKLIGYMSGFEGKRGRRPNAYFACIDEIKKTIHDINDVKSKLQVRDDKATSNDKRMDNVDLSAFDKESEQSDIKKKARGFEIKSLSNDDRLAIENLFTINKDENEKGRSIEEKLKGKNVVIFDDNISSGATLDDMCLTLQKCGVKGILPITMAIIAPTGYGDFSGKQDFYNRKPSKSQD